MCGDPDTNPQDVSVFPRTPFAGVVRRSTCRRVVGYVEGGVMRNLLVGIGSVISLISAVSVAQADPFNFGPDGPSGPWSGFYLGANGGKSWFNGSDQLNLPGIDNGNDPAFAIFVSKGTDFGDDGSFAGGQLGYAFQRGIFV